jgi:hypothetical protein
VLWFHSKEVAQMLEATEESVNSALKRSRAMLRQRTRGAAMRDEHYLRAPPTSARWSHDSRGRFSPMTSTPWSHY